MSIDATQSQRDGASDGASDGTGVPAAEPGRAVLMPAQPRGRRRPLLVAAMVGLVCLGALVSAWAYMSTSTAQEVLAVRETVYRGEVIDRTDLITVRVGVDPALAPLGAAKLETVVGQRAALDLAAGSLVTAADVATSVLPTEGRSIVGVSLTSAMMPSVQLLAGDTVRIVATPGAQGDVGAETPEAIEATVVGIRRISQTGERVVDVSVPREEAAALAARAATGKVALILDSRER